MTAYITKKNGITDPNPLGFDTLTNAISFAKANCQTSFDVEDRYNRLKYIRINDGWDCYDSLTSEEIEPSDVLKPPLGLTPRSIVETTRATDVKEAIVRYCEHGLEIPLEWIEEYNEYVGRNK